MVGLQVDETSGDTSFSGPPIRKIAETAPEVRSDGSPAAGIHPSATLLNPYPVVARKKRYHHKTRTGCFTCRRRRIKCDEQRPSCLRCCKINESCQYEREPPAAQSTLLRCQPSKIPSTSDKIDVSFIQFFLENTKDTLSTPPSSLADHRPVMPLDPDMAMARFWDSLGLPLIHVEPLILELVVLLAKKHRRTLEESQPNDEEFWKVINVMTKIVKTRPQDIVVIGSMLTSAFQVLHSTSMKDYSLSDDGVHKLAFSKLLLNSSDVVFEYVKPITDVTRVTLAMCLNALDDQSPKIPEEFLDVEDARHYLAAVLKLPLPKLRPALQRWLSVMSRLYELARGKDWERSKTTLTLFIYGRHILVVSDIFTSAGHELIAVSDALEARGRSMSPPIFQYI